MISFKNLHIKILAFLSAIALWLFVVGIENNVSLFPEDISISLQNLSPELNVATEIPSVKIRVRSPRDLTKNLTQNDFEAYLDLKDLTSGEHTLPVIVKSKRDKVEVLKIEPSSLTVKLEANIEKNVAIQLNTIGKPQEGYQVKSIKSSFKEAKIRGLKNIVDTIEGLKADIQLDGTQNKNFSQHITLKLPENKNEFADRTIIDPQAIDIDIEIEKIAADESPDSQDASGLEQKSVVIKPNLQGSLNLYSFYQDIKLIPLTAVIRGKKENLQNITFLETEAIDIEWLQSQTGPVQRKLLVPEGIELISPNDGFVNVQLKFSSNGQ